MTLSRFKTIQLQQNARIVPGFFVPMTTQTEIANHLGISQQAVSKTLSKMGIEWKDKSLDEIRLAYCARLREQASGHANQLMLERVETEKVDRELKLYQLAEKKKELINVEDLKSELVNIFAGFRQELLSRDDKLKTELDTLYGIDIDVSILNEYTYNALSHLSGYLGGYQPAAKGAGADTAASEEDGDNGVG